MGKGGYILAVPRIPIWLKVAMWIAFFVILGGWAVLMRFVWYEWLPPWLVDVAFVVLVGVLAYFHGYERGQRVSGKPGHRSET